MRTEHYTLDIANNEDRRVARLAAWTVLLGATASILFALGLFQSEPLTKLFRFIAVHKIWAWMILIGAGLIGVGLLKGRREKRSDDETRIHPD